MTEMTETSQALGNPAAVPSERLQLTPVMERFILHWGDMGPRWGINRTIAQIHALLYIWPTPLTAEQIASTLSVARSNVSVSLRQLQEWGIVKPVRLLGDRRDHFQTMTDVWEMFRLIMAERRKREIDPTLEVLRECAAQARKPGSADAHAQQKLDELLGFFETVTRWHEQFHGLARPALIRLAKMGRHVRKLLRVAS